MARLYPCSERGAGSFYRPLLLVTINVTDVMCSSSRAGTRRKDGLEVSIARIYRLRGGGGGGKGMHACWLRNCGTMPSSPLGSPARSLQYSVVVPSDPSSLLCPIGRVKWRGGGRRGEQQIVRDTGRAREQEEVWARVQPIWDALHRQSVPEVTDKADPIFVECLKVPCEKMSFRRE